MSCCRDQTAVCCWADVLTTAFLVAFLAGFADAWALFWAAFSAGDEIAGVLNDSTARDNANIVLKVTVRITTSLRVTSSSLHPVRCNRARARTRARVTF